jgi:hypothetical protein
MSEPIARRLLAGAWLGPWLAGLALFGAGWLRGVPIDPALAGLVLAASLLAGAPAALFAARCGAVLAPLRLALPAAFAMAAAGAVLWVGTEVGGALAAGFGAAGLASLWIGAAVATTARRPHARLLLAAAAGLGLALWALAGSAGVFMAIGLAGAIHGLGTAAPTALALRRPATGGAPALVGLLLALAVLAGPFGIWLAGDDALAAAMALLVALPGLGALAALPEGNPWRLGLAVLLTQALATNLALFIVAAPVAADLLPVASLGTFRWALLGGGFLPVFCALLAAPLAARPPRALLPLAVLGTLGLALPAMIGPAGLLLAPLAGILAAAFGAMLWPTHLADPENRDAARA